MDLPEQIDDRVPSQIVFMYERLVELLNELGKEALKNARGNNEAGIRLRKGLKTVKNLAHQLQMLSLELDRKRSTFRKLHRRST